MALFGAIWFGGYANTFQPIPEDWKLNGKKQIDGFLNLRSGLDPASYAEYASHWLQARATVVGERCGTGPEHIAIIKELMNDEHCLKLYCRMPRNPTLKKNNPPQESDRINRPTGTMLKPKVKGRPKS